MTHLPCPPHLCFLPQHRLQCRSTLGLPCTAFAPCLCAVTAATSSTWKSCPCQPLGSARVWPLAEARDCSFVLSAPLAPWAWASHIGTSLFDIPSRFTHPEGGQCFNRTLDAGLLGLVRAEMLVRLNQGMAFRGQIEFVHLGLTWPHHPPICSFGTPVSTAQVRC